MDTGGSRLAPQAPLCISNITPASLAAEADEILANSRALRDRLVAEFTSETATFANFVRPLIDDENKNGYRLTTLGWLLARTSTDAGIRAASRAVQAKLSARENTYHHRQDMAGIVDGIFARRNEDKSLDEEDLYFLSVMHKKFATSGATVTDEAKRGRMHDIKSEISNILIEAQKAATESSNGIAFTEGELGGVPPNWLASLGKAESAADDRIEKLWVPLSSNNVVNILQSARNENTRRKMFVADVHQTPENIDLLSKLIVLRHELATICGFKNHAELKMEERMEGSAESVMEKLEELKRGARLPAIQEAEELLLYKQNKDDNEPTVQDATTLYAWDRLFYAKKQAKEKYQVDAERISEYFEASHTLQQMLLIFEQLFGMEFIALKDADVWHDSVLAYSVWNSKDLDGEFLGYLYLDVFSREGKYQAPHHMGFQGGFVEANGVKHYPVSALICAFQSSTPESPSLLQHRDVKIMFHELGHAIHFMVERTRYAIHHSRDYAEIPSRFLEHFVWIPEVLFKLGKHYTHLEDYRSLRQEPHDPYVPADGIMPRELAERIAQTQYQNHAISTLSMLCPGLFDLSIYSPVSIEDARAIDTTALWNQIKRETLPFSMGAGEDLGYGQASAPWVFRNTDAAYYTYVLSSTYAADIFAERFAGDPLNKRVALKWRKHVLERGSGQSELALLEGFVGRPLSSKGMVDLLQQQRQAEGAA